MGAKSNGENTTVTYNGTEMPLAAALTEIITNTISGSAIVNKVDKADGKGLSTEDFTTALKNKLDTLPSITSSDVTNRNSKASTDVATTTSNGLMSASDKTRLDGIRGVRYGTGVPIAGQQ